MLPNFIIAGATRSGTTSLYYYLSQHPDISFPKLKEPRYFSSIDLILPQRGPGDYSVDKKLVFSFKQYKNLYKNINNKIVGDASSEYLYHHGIAAQKIKKVLGDIPIIIILRNPIYRAFSAYNNLVRDDREHKSFTEALLLEDERIKQNWDMMWHYKQVGLYSNQVKTYMTTFSKVKIIIFENFITNPLKHLFDIFNFLNIEKFHKINVDTQYSLSGVPKNRIIELLSSRRIPYVNFFREQLLKIVPREYLERVSQTSLKKAKLDKDIILELNDFYKNDIKILEKILGVNILEWKIDFV